MSKVHPSDETEGVQISEKNGDVTYEKNGDVTTEKNGDVSGEKAPEQKEGDEAAAAGEWEEPPSVGCAALFRFADGFDIFLMIVGSLGAAASGTALPLILLLFGDMTNIFITDQILKNIYTSTGLAAQNITLSQLQNNATVRTYVANNFNISWDYLTSQLTTSTSTSLLDQMTGFSYYYVGIGFGALVCCYLQQMCWLTAAERQTKRIRAKFFWAIMRQDIGWFDTHETGELNTRLSDDLNKIHDGIGDKVATFIQWFVGFVAGIILAFVKGWKLTLVILSSAPLLVASAAALSIVTTVMTAKELGAYAKAGAIAEEVIAGIRTVTAFGGQKKECARYSGNLHEAASYGVKKATVTGVVMGLLWFVFLAAYGLGFWYGAKLVREESQNYDAGTIMTVFFAAIMAAFSLGSAFPNLGYVGIARGAAYTIYGIIDQEPSIDSASTEGVKPDHVEGTVEFSDVYFNYPSRADVKVLQGLSLKVEIGQTAALVGSSGCGKSTTIQLLQRFYDTDQGQVKLDGRDVRDLNVQWLRRQLGVVSQEPVLFATTIAENIRYGRDDVTDEEIEEACRMSNAFDFVQALPDKFETIVGERGAQLSGGQKQRIAIARALVRNPKILLLDEATSALDTESEAVVQEALDKASKGRTTIVIAHRLSTIKTANVIMGIKEGKVVEDGSHDQLMSKQGLYHQLVQNQSSGQQDDDDDDDKKELAEELKILQSQMQEEDEETKKKLRDALVKQGIKLEDGASEEKGSDDKKGEEAAAAEEGGPQPPSMGRLLSLNSPEWPFLLLGCFGALLNGGIQPAFAIIFSEIISVFAETDINKFEDQVALYSCIFLGLGALMFVTNFFQHAMFGKSGEALTMRLRQQCFEKILSFEIGWFDNHSNSTGSVCTRLSTEASLVQGATGARLGMMVRIVANLGTSIIIAFYYGWQLTLVILAFGPVMMISGIIQMQIMTGVEKAGKLAYEEAGKIATEVITNMRTVATLTKEPHFHKEYMDKLEPIYKASLRRAQIEGLAYGISQSVIFFAYAATFQMGAYLISKDILSFNDVLKVFSAVIYGAMGAGEASAMAPDYGKAMIAAAQVFAMLDRESHIDPTSEDGEKPSSCKGEVAAKEVRFRYPSRPDVPVLRGLSMNGVSGQTIALVGSSGCGKSTVLQLIQRFYDPLLGEMQVDSKNVTSLNVGFLRSQIGIVSQEPTLFDASIRDNIAYGDCSRDVSMDEIISAARNANIHSFVEGLPQGYDTNVGDKGTQLSGGQKQRIAIARALVRDPKILLLDEATSALDTESEKIVQEALDRAQKGRTSIVIAHRLSTIQNADIIFVVHHGHVVEQGNHASLMSAKGRYYTLHQKGQLKQQ